MCELFVWGKGGRGEGGGGEGRERGEGRESGRLWGKGLGLRDEGRCQSVRKS